MALSGSDDERLVLSREALREVDRLAVEEFAIPSIVLMENAARGLARRALGFMRERGLSRAVILAGPGNNGGDGFALARHLRNAGVEVTILTTHPDDRYAGDAGVNLLICRRMGLAIQTLPPDETAGRVAARRIAQTHAESRALIVDALLGTGLDRPVEGAIASVIGAVNALGDPRPPVLSVDIPSGLDADTGRPLGVAVRADLTVTLAARKRGFDAPGGASHTGKVVVEAIGAPRELIRRLADDES